MKFYRTNQAFKAISVYIALNIMFPQTLIQNTFALTGGPSQPEFNSFTPIGTSDMVDLTSGDFNYNIPVMDVGGYPLNLAYKSGVNMDQEASWVGLGWNLNVGQIKRSVRGLPDDFDGDKMIYENNFKTNRTVGANFGVGASIFGFAEVSGGIGVEYNNYNGTSFKPSIGVGAKLGNIASVGIDVSGSVADGPTVSPSVSLSKKIGSSGNKINANIGLSINSRQALTSLNLSSNATNLISNNGSIKFNDNLTFTPTKRVSTLSDNFTFNAAVGGTAFGISGQVKVTGYGSSQFINPFEKHKLINAYGYENTEKNEDSNNGILDFNREKDGVFSKNTSILPITNYTYDQYSIAGQGVSGTFRPYRSQIGFVNDPLVFDDGTGSSFGVELQIGWNFAKGVDYKKNNSYARTGVWGKRTKNYALKNFKSSNDNNLDFEKVYFRNESELNVDNENEEAEEGLYSKILDGDNPVNIGLGGGYRKRRTESFFNTTNNTPIPFSNKIQRSKRLLRNQSIQKLTVEDIRTLNRGMRRSNSGLFQINDSAKVHHTAGFNVLKPDGARYVYGKAVYNTKKVEATFAAREQGDCTTGLVEYKTMSVENIKTGKPYLVPNYRNDHDEYFNRVTTPAYAHSYLLTSVLSADYEDRTGNGVSEDDFGSYTKFNYSRSYNYNWRIPYLKDKATFNKGLYSHPKDQKGNYIYGEREQSYIESIETKTHIAKFILSDRKDGFGVVDEQGGRSQSTTTKKINKIVLYSKEDVTKPIKTAHFVYDYLLCQGIPNNNQSQNLDSNEQKNQGGKLTLKKVYFTYENSKMGAYMPYEFDYGQMDIDNDGEYDYISNPNYNIKGYDIWGNYKENIGSCNLNGVPSNSEFPYTLQNSRLEADKNTVAWTLTSINLPSGGTMDIQYESDDYQFVQNKKIMQLYQVTGVGVKSGKTTSDGVIQNKEIGIPTEDELINTRLYSKDIDNKYLYVKIPKNQSKYDKEEFYKGLEEEPIFFNFLLSMTNQSNQFDFVTGYFLFDKKREITKIQTSSNDTYLCVPMELVKLDGKSNDRFINPISKAGMYFGRKNMNRIVYDDDGDYKNSGIVDIVEDLVGSIGTLFQIGQGPNFTLRNKGCANKFKSNKSWIRLYNPTKAKFGGGVRVKKLQMSDNWDEMTGNKGNSLYKKFYGQVYSYKKEDGTTSGVATFEPNGSRENPFVKPFYNKKPSGADKVLAPRELNYVEKPIGESFFPSPSVTYGRVEVKNLPYENINKHATGKVVNEFYTSYDFPTKTKHTELAGRNFFQDPASATSNFLNWSVKNHYTASQGFVIERNDMNGKQKAQWVYQENKEVPISGMEYKYNLKDNGEVQNRVPVVDENGVISQKLIGVNYDVVNDFRETKSVATSAGVNFNVAGFYVVIWFVVAPVPIPSYSYNENVLHTAVTTKVVHKQGLLKEKIAHDLGAKAATENIAWDANTGHVLVTKTENDFDEKYYNVNYPAYWKYKGMGAASKNLGLEGVLSSENNNSTFNLIEGNAKDFLQPGDELLVNYRVKRNGLGGYLGLTKENYQKLWVANVNNDDVVLMKHDGKILNDCPEDERLVGQVKFKVIRSGYRNLQNASMASITTKINPIVEADGRTYRDRLFAYYNVNPEDAKIINASAVEYSDYWKPVNQEGNKYYVETSSMYTDYANTTGANTDIVENQELLNTFDKYDINPYVYNIKGDWRAKRSWAYLTGRQHSYNVNTKNNGYFTSFTPFYKYNNGAWEINAEAVDKTSTNKWTFASEVTQYAPYGVELENKDALNRYSAAQYGYKYTLPTAVASNSQYKEIGFDGFEDYEEVKEPGISSHFSFGDVHGVNAYAITTDKEAHTGRKSMAVPPNSKVSLIKNLVDVNAKEIEDCETTTNTETTVKDISYTYGKCSFTANFTFVGQPNSNIEYSVNGGPNTVTLDSSGFKAVNHTVGFYNSSNGNNCIDPSASNTYTNAQIVVRDINNNILLMHGKQYNCSDCIGQPIDQATEFSITNEYDCKTEIFDLLIKGTPLLSVTYYIWREKFTVKLDASGRYTTSHKGILEEPLCFSGSGASFTKEGVSKLLILDEDFKRVIDIDERSDCNNNCK